MSSGKDNKQNPAPAEGNSEVGRRRLLSGIGAGVVGAALGVPALLSVRSLVPNALYEKPRRFKVGRRERFTSGPTFIAEHRVFVFREGGTFYCMGAICTHLGCTVQLVRKDVPRQAPEFEFHCPCHGSKFRADGTNFEGPAPAPLAYYRLELAADDGQLVVDLSQTADKGWRFSA